MFQRFQINHRFNQRLPQRRNNRLTTRLAFMLVLLAILVGGWFADSYLRVDLRSLQAQSTSEDSDWVTFASDIGEQALQLFLGVASKTQ